MLSSFEGAEKLNETWFAPSAEHVLAKHLPIKGGRTEYYGLRQVERQVWEGMLDTVQCKILSVIQGEEVDAYLLSESSMFVWPHKIILKTCGTTTLLLGLPHLLKIASEICGLHSVYRCFYSRKTFMFPDQQKGPHKDWTEEMGFLDNLFDNSSAYTVGKMNGDHWLLYITPPQAEEAAFTSPDLPVAAAPSLLHSLSASLLPALPHSVLSASDSPPSALLSSSSSFSDQTLEILMTRLDPTVCSSFYHPSSTTDASYTSPLFASDPSDADSHALGAALSTRLGLSALLPKATVDSFLFSPCGFSSNAVQGDRYATIHVTPEVEYSYASFETNLSFDHSSLVQGTTMSSGLNSGGGITTTKTKTTTKDDVEEGHESVQELVEKVLNIFKPAKFSITLFVSMEDDLVDPTSPATTTLATAALSITSRRDILLSTKLAEEQYTLVDRIVYEFEGYNLLYIVYEEKVTTKKVVVGVNGNTNGNGNGVATSAIEEI